MSERINIDGGQFFFYTGKQENKLQVRNLIQSIPGVALTPRDEVNWPTDYALDEQGTGGIREPLSADIIQGYAINTKVFTRLAHEIISAGFASSTTDEVLRFGPPEAVIFNANVWNKNDYINPQ